MYVRPNLPVYPPDPLVILYFLCFRFNQIFNQVDGKPKYKDKNVSGFWFIIL